MSRTRIAIVAACIAAGVVPLLANALTHDEIVAQIQSLRAQIAALKQQAGISQDTSASIGASAGAALPSQERAATYSCITLQRALSFGARGDDVSKLQQYLTLNSDIYPEASITGYFGAATERAVGRWQTQHGLISSGDAVSGWGVVGPRTRAAMADCTRIVSPGCPALPQTPLDTLCRGGIWSKKYNANGCHVDWSCSGTYTPPALCSSVPMPPASSCVGMWKPNNDANGCAASWQCNAVSACIMISRICPAGQHDQVGSDCTHTCVADTSVVSCPLYQVPLCQSGYTLQDGGTDTNGCKLPAKCVAAVVSCPLYQVPLCQSGYTLQDGGTDTNGCKLPAKCVAATASVSFTASPTSGGAPLAVQFSVPASSVTYFGAVSLNFGDGTSAVACNPGSACVAKAISHSYTSTGTYTVTLSGAGEGSNYALGTTTITVY